MRVTLFGVRGSIPTSDPDKLRYGGHTSCVAVELDGGRLILDAGSGIRNLGRSIFRQPEPVHILLSHLHLDHVLGLLFFAPFFDPSAQVTVWGPNGSFRGLRRSLSRYLSQPLSPVEIRELPAHVAFEEVPAEPFRLLGAEITAGLVTHRGPTVGYRVRDNGHTLCYLPDHEPALGDDLDSAPREWVSGLSLAAGADLLIHDAQYTREEYRATLGWGHSTIPDALRFARRADAARTLLFHHDPGHDDTQLDALGEQAVQLWESDGGDPTQVAMAAEGSSYEL
jgi:phosphoribosyl 1,2-cyclic phosphodiesterase